MIIPSQVLAETEIFHGVRYNKEDISSCREEADFEGLKGDDLIDYVQTCLEDFQGMADYENMMEEKAIQKEKQN
jgi:hypothetical protein